jgi:hypothetical protein
VRLPVVGDTGQEERDGDHGRGGNARRDERRSRLDPPPREHDPRGDHRCRHEHPAPRVGEDDRHEPPVGEQRAEDAPPPREPKRERQRVGAEQRELVPDPDRRAQARDPPVVVVQPGKRLAGERPDDDRAEDRREAGREPARPVGEEEPERGERRVDERPVGVGP